MGMLISFEEVARVRPGREGERAAEGRAQEFLPLLPAVSGSDPGSGREVLVIFH